MVGPSQHSVCIDLYDNLPSKWQSQNPDWEFCLNKRALPYPCSNIVVSFQKARGESECTRCSHSVVIAPVLTRPFSHVSRNMSSCISLLIWTGRPHVHTRLYLFLFYFFFQGNMSRGNSLFFRKVPFGKTYCCDLRMLIWRCGAGTVTFL